MEAVGNSNTRPKLLLKQFHSYRYAHQDPQSQISGDTGYFQEPNQLLMTGSLKSIQHRKPHQQEVYADRAVATFDAVSIQDVLDGAATKNIKLFENIKLLQSQDAILTTQATYDIKTDRIYSDAPVRVEGQKRWSTGEHGFIYDMSSSNVEVFGPIEGVVDPNELSQSHHSD
ncbi:MAG: LPS export ABC transporter periplasmic protein LptC [Oligoflexales bacterium]